MVQGEIVDTGRSDRIRVNEMFWSAQGEGVRTGVASAFLRLSGCSLRCIYCDSKESWDEGDELGEDEIISRLESIGESRPFRQIVITGGEPLEQDVEGLVDKLRKRGHYICVETNGVHDSNAGFDWWTVSPKDVHNYRINENLWDRISEIKLIVNKNLNAEIVWDISRRRKDIPVFLQPSFPDPERFISTFGLFEECIGEKMDNVRLGMQLHRIYNIR